MDSMPHTDEDRLAGWMRRMAGAPGDDTLPEADAIWWRAQLRRRLAFEERATRPIRIAERVACSVCLATIAVLAAVLTRG